MDTNLVNEFMQDLKVEAIKLNLQLSCPYVKYQKNDVLRTTITAFELDSVYAMNVIRTAIAALTECESVFDLQELYNEWNETRIDIQYKSYGYDSKAKGQAYAYVFLMRTLRKRHKELYNYMKMINI